MNEVKIVEILKKKQRKCIDLNKKIFFYFVYIKWLKLLEKQGKEMAYK